MNKSCTLRFRILTSSRISYLEDRRMIILFLIIARKLMVPIFHRNKCNILTKTIYQNVIFVIHIFHNLCGIPVPLEVHWMSSLELFPKPLMLLQPDTFLPHARLAPWDTTEQQNMKWELRQLEPFWGRVGFKSNTHTNKRASVAAPSWWSCKNILQVIYENLWNGNENCEERFLCSLHCVC